MTFEEYIADRDEATDRMRQYTCYRHTKCRLHERFGISRQHWNLEDWAHISYECLTREHPIISRHKQAIFCVSEYSGEEIVWVYSRVLKCIVTVLRADEVGDRLKYMDALRRTR